VVIHGVGKTTFVKEIQNKLSYSHSTGRFIHINNDFVRQTLSRDLSFSLEDRLEQSRRMAAIADIIVKSNGIALADFICPTFETRQIFKPDLVVLIKRKTQSQYAGFFNEPDDEEAGMLDYDLLIATPENYFETLSQVVHYMR
jgi:hypothetical protein